MKHHTLLVAALVLPLLTVGPQHSFADDAPPAPSDPILPDEDDLRALGDMAQRMMRDFADRMMPMAEKLKALVDDIDAYEAPEMLPNGDIIIRRKSDAEPVEPNTTEDSISL